MKKWQKITKNKEFKETRYPSSPLNTHTHIAVAQCDETWFIQKMKNVTQYLVIIYKPTVLQFVLS